MKGKIIISAVSLILVVGVAIGVIVAVNKKGGDNVETHQANAKYITTMCQNTDDQKLCHDTLGSVKGANESDPKAYIAASVKAAADTLIKALNMSDKLSVDYGSKDAGIKMALDDCKDLLQSAMQSLDLSSTLLNDNNIYSVHTQTPDLRNWLSAVISYQQTCMDGFDDGKDSEKKIKDTLNEQNLDLVQKFTSIALDIVTDLTNILQQFGLKLDLNPTSRRLLGGVEVDSEGLPTWFSTADRKLLGKNWKANTTPNMVVAKDGSGQFKTIQAAIDSYPAGFKGRYIIYVKAGVYAEYVIVPKTAVNIFMYGDGPAVTIITGNKNFANGVKTMQTATFANTANGFLAKDIRFENTAGAIGHQAVALRNQGDMSAFVGCHIYGYQDTLYAQTNRQFYTNCEITGTIDFIFGTSATLIQNCKIIVMKPLNNQFNTVTADGTSAKNMATGIVIQNCVIAPEPALFPVRFQLKSYLGRPWKAYSKTVVMESTIGDLIDPAGWIPWAGSIYLDTLYYAEYANTGPGAAVQGRIKWKGYRGVISKTEASQFTVGQFLKAGPNSTAETWLRALQAPFYSGFARP